ncbi:hypothetical protein ACFL2F_00640, partial [Myxococcota bacterium]
VFFDSDPANIIHNSGDGELVIVDPICEKVNIGDYNFVVFLFGLIKALLGSATKHKISKATRILYEYYRAYEQISGKSWRQLNIQLYTYAGIVMMWNRDRWRATSNMEWMLRMVTTVPALHLFRALCVIMALLPGKGFYKEIRKLYSTTSIQGANDDPM